MEADNETQEFLDLYVQTGQKTYSPPQTRDVEGEIAIHEHIELIRHKENLLLNDLRNHRFA